MLPTTVELLREAELLTITSHRVNREQFLSDEVLKRAFVRSLEVIGEAAKRVPIDTRACLSAIEWSKMAGMRDRLIHDYGAVDYEIVWDVAVHKAPSLAAQLRHMLQGVADTPPPA